jgi:hypothetical protein
MKEQKSNIYSITVTNDGKTDIYRATTIKELSKVSGLTLKTINNRVYKKVKDDNIFVEKSIETIKVPTARDKIKYTIELNGVIHRCRTLNDGAKLLNCSTTKIHRILKKDNLINKYNITKLN